jgi:predicted acyltransferase
MSAPATNTQRLGSLDAFRGLVMLFMATNGLGLAYLARSHPDSDLWAFLAHHMSHVAWVGMGCWDLIQPAFMLMVGVAIPFSLASRRRAGDSETRILLHAVWRACLLVALAIFLTTGNRPQPEFAFHNVLAQIGLGYVFVFLLAGRGWKLQTAAIALLALGTWAAFAHHPLPGPGTNFRDFGVTGEKLRQCVLPGFLGHWSMGTNFAADFDRWFLNLFPTAKPFVFNGGGYQTLNFVPSIITMTLGLMAGEKLRAEGAARGKLLWIVGVGAACVALGWLAGATVCPMVKRLWTPSWALASGGLALWGLALAYFLIDLRGYKTWAFPFTVVGMNAIAVYVAHSLFAGPLADIGRTYLGRSTFEGAYGPIWISLFVVGMLWLFAYWLHRRQLTLKL